MSGTNEFYDIIYSTDFELPTVNVALVVTNVYPLQGSLVGGSELTITGTGFGIDESVVSVTIGRKECAITSFSYMQIICEISDAGEVHKVTNNGIDPGMFRKIHDVPD